MSEAIQEPVVEQTDESLELEVGSKVSEDVPTTSKVEDAPAEI